ncbi:hypothetical protein KVR01_011632 [Diaporthe batatas]|uniref:uncharacterized protein n=1 Tax=Diaporthe batatas TaxID=748121 RepID=UPI001D04C0DD|nr:uncharacterized protein KVR01_011632 [Diaporthe batatas]KAG8158510.1 hypothetical protein KVR01_011632 [Diaporthe batatas]
MATILEVLFTISRINSGLSQGISTIRYSWSYGTTGILTLTAALWHRLDYETKVLAPWLRPYSTTTSKAAWLLDYVNAWSLVVPFQALRNQDYEVLCSSTVSLLLQVLIVLSTALFTLTPTNLVEEAEPIFLTSRFVDDPARLMGSESLLPYYITMGTGVSMGNLSDMVGENSVHPEGCTTQFAYQTFHPASSTLEEVRTTVDGLSLRLACETGSVGEKVPMPSLYIGAYGVSWEGEPYFEVEYQGCQATIHWELFTSNSQDSFWVDMNHDSNEHWMVLRDVPGFALNQCNSTEHAASRLVFLSAEVELRSNNQSTFYDDEGFEKVQVNIDATVSQAVVLVCAPSLEQTLLDISWSSGGVQHVSRHGDDLADVLSLIQPWDFIDFFLDEDILPALVGNEVAVGNTTVWADVYSQVVLGFCGQSCLTASGLLNDTASLQKVLSTFLADYASSTAHTMLTEGVNITSTGTSSSIGIRLWVQPLVCQAMVMFLALIILTIVGFQFKFKNKLTRRVDPGSVAATALLAGQVASSSFPKDLGAANAKDLHEALDRFLANRESLSSDNLQPPTSTTVEDASLTRTITEARPSLLSKADFQNPLPLRPVSYIALILTIVACGTILMFLFRKSTDGRGLGDVATSEYVLIAWTTAPATILTVISWWLSSIDTQIRLSAPYQLLKSDRCKRPVLRMDLMRGLIPFIIWRELKSSSFAAASTTLAALLAAILTTVSAAVFHVVPFPVSKPVELSSNTAFMEPASISNSETSRLASLILETNLSYPRGSYQDLVFPEFSMTPLSARNASDKTNASSAIIKVTAPALRPHLRCTNYSPVDIAAVNVRNRSSPKGQDQWNGIVVNIPSENCRIYANSHETALFETGNLSETIFATATTYNKAGTIEIMARSCSDVLYIWGYHDTSPGPVTNISAAGCNKSVELVDVTISLLEPDFRLDLSDAPAIVESTARDIREDSFMGLSHLDGSYYGLASLPITTHGVFDSFFRQLVTSRYAISISSIGDPTQAEIVMDAIRLQHGIIEAQFLNSNYRTDMDSSNAINNASALVIPTLFNQSTSNGASRFPATVTYPFGSHRVVQDPTATAVLGALLLGILVLVILGWYLVPNEPALPRSPSSVGSLLALLAGGNVLEHLYDGGPEPLCWDDVKCRLGKDSKLHLGWNSLNGDEGDDQQRFGIWIAD